MLTNLGFYRTIRTSSLFMKKMRKTLFPATTSMPQYRDHKLQVVQRQDETVRDINARLATDRKRTAQHILDFNFDTTRVQTMNRGLDIPQGSNGIVYWMQRDQRVQDNWAMLYAQQLAMKNKLSLHVVYCLVPKFLDATYRQYYFLLKGLEEVEAECRKLGIGFHLLLGEARNTLPEFIRSRKVGGLVTDFSPLRLHLAWQQDIKEAVTNIPVYRVDAHNVIPCWVTSNKLEVGAYSIRPKVHQKLSHYLTRFPPVVEHPYKSKFQVEPANWTAADEFLEVDRSVEPVAWATPGTKAGHEILDQFCIKKMYKYVERANDPNDKARSDISPWLHFGQVSPQRCALEADSYRNQIKDAVDGFIEQMVVRRELSDNFCFYEENYDSLEGAFSWARDTLEFHKRDRRQYVYTKEELNNAKTHDELWNASQLQLVKDGKMHGYMRIYWAKKILEWTQSPEEALEIAIYLNDRYNLDGRDANGYTGIMWSICGVHDKQFNDRPVYGKIRYVSSEGYKKKFNGSLFVQRYGARKHRYNPAY